MQANTSTDTLYVSIDVGKNVNCYGAYAGERLELILPAVTVRNTLPGYTQFHDWLAEQLESGRYAKVVVGLEPTGIYHDGWANALGSWKHPALEVRLVNPYLTKQKRRDLQSGRPRKTDERDVQAIAHCLRDGQGDAWWTRNRAERELEMWATDYRRWLATHRQQQLRILTQIDHLWQGALVKVKAFQQAHPGMATPICLVKSHALERQLVRTIMLKQPNPYDWLSLSVKEIGSLIRKHGLRCGVTAATRVHAVVHQALLLPPDHAQLLALRLQRELGEYIQEEQRLLQLRHEAERLIPHTHAAVLTTIPGVSAFLAAQYVALIGDVKRFQYADQIWSLAGFDISQNDSGDRRCHGKISRHGLPALRDILFNLGQLTSRACPAIAAIKERARKRGKRGVAATLHAAHKVNRLCFTLLKHQLAFDPALMK